MWSFDFKCAHLADLAELIIILWFLRMGSMSSQLNFSEEKKDFQFRLIESFIVFDCVQVKERNSYFLHFQIDLCSADQIDCGKCRSQAFNERQTLFAVPSFTFDNAIAQTIELDNL